MGDVLQVGSHVSFGDAAGATEGQTIKKRKRHEVAQRAARRRSRRTILSFREHMMHSQSIELSSYIFESFGVSTFLADVETWKSPKCTTFSTLRRFCFVSGHDFSRAVKV
jgi:hypothetical protein